MADRPGLRGGARRRCQGFACSRIAAALDAARRLPLLPEAVAEVLRHSTRKRQCRSQSVRVVTSLDGVAHFTHITREKDEKAICRNGIKPTRVGADVAGVYAMPVLPNFFASHPWLRELRRLGSTPLVAIDFVVPDLVCHRRGRRDESRRFLCGLPARRPQP